MSSQLSSHCLNMFEPIGSEASYTVHLVYRTSTAYKLLMGDEACFVPPVTTLTESSSEEAVPPPSAGRKRARNKSRPLRKKPPVDDVVAIQSMLSKASKCKGNCREQFRGKASQQELIQFRKEWNELHKTDQDEVVACTMRQVNGFSDGFLSATLRYLFGTSLT